MDLIRKAAPNNELILPLSEVKGYCNVDFSDASNDVVLGNLRDQAREYIENLTKTALGEQTWILFLDDFPSLSKRRPKSTDEWQFSDRTALIELNRPPLVSVTSVKYLDQSGIMTVLNASKYLVRRAGDERGYLQPQYGQSWPLTRGVTQSVEIEFVCGFKVGASFVANETELPEPLIRAMLVFIEDAYSNRAGGVLSEDSSKTINRLVSPYRSERFGFVA